MSGANSYGMLGIIKSHINAPPNFAPNFIIQFANLERNFQDFILNYYMQNSKTLMYALIDGPGTCSYIIIGLFKHTCAFRSERWWTIQICIISWRNFAQWLVFFVHEKWKGWNRLSKDAYWALKKTMIAVFSSTEFSKVVVLTPNLCPHPCSYFKKIDKDNRLRSETEGETRDGRYGIVHGRHSHAALLDPDGEEDGLNAFP